MLAAIQKTLFAKDHYPHFSLFHFTADFWTDPKKMTAYLLTQYNKTISDRTIGNNPWAIGFGLQTFFKNKMKFKPTIELTGDIYLEDDKVLRLNSDGSIPTKANDVRGMINLFAGLSFNPAQNIYFSFLPGQVLLVDRFY